MVKYAHLNSTISAYFSAGFGPVFWTRLSPAKLINAGVLSLILSVTGISHRQDPEWELELERDRDGIQVFTRSVVGSPYKEMKSLSLIQGVSLTSLVALIEDAQACPQCADKCAESYLVERLSETESLVYNHNEMPFPVTDRDVVARVT